MIMLSQKTKRLTISLPYSLWQKVNLKIHKGMVSQYFASLAQNDLLAISDLDPTTTLLDYLKSNSTPKSGYKNMLKALNKEH